MDKRIRVLTAGITVVLAAGPAIAAAAAPITRDELDERPGKQPKRFRRMKDWEMSSGKKRG